MPFDYLATSQFNIAWLNANRMNDSIILRPVFQRRSVWLPPQQSYLIDSILRGYPIPELYMQDVVDSEGGQMYRVVDGQQRLRAVFDFIDGKYELGQYEPPKGDEPPLYPGDTFGDLKDDIKRKFWEYTFVVRKLPDIGDTELRVIFQRLNRNVQALNQQELRHSAYVGPFIRVMESLADDEFWSRSGIFTPNDIRRMYDVEFISELAIGYLHGPQNKKATLDRWYAAYEPEFPQEAEVVEVFRTVLGELDQVIPELSRTRWSKKSDFYTLFHLLADSRAKLPLSREGRNALGERLKELGPQIDEQIANPKGTRARALREYAAAVERAASDLGNRRRRMDALRKLLPIQ